MKNMKNRQIVVIAFLIALSICVFASTQAKAQTPLISLGSTGGYVDSTVPVSGSGFAANSAFSASFADSTVPLSGTTTTDGSGNIPSGVTFARSFFCGWCPTSRCTDSSSNSGSATFTVTPSISLSSSSGSVGDSVTVSGTGFAGTSSITLAFDGVTQFRLQLQLLRTHSGHFQV